MAELRYHPFLQQWVVVASHRQARTHLPPEEHCPLCPTAPGSSATEIPIPTYQVAVFENRFPSLLSNPPEVDSPGEVLRAAPALGTCEVVCYTPDHNKTFADLSAREAFQLAMVWRDRYLDLAHRPEVRYVFIFENRGREIGVTLTHPHGQIYAYPFVPPLAKARLEAESNHWQECGTYLADDWLNEELASAERVLTENEDFAAICPYFARFPFEVHVVAKGPWNSLASIPDSGLKSLAGTLSSVAKSYDRLFGFPLPYIMAMHQFEADYTRFCVEFSPLHRTETKLKYLAGSETAKGTFILDVAPEEAADRLRACWTS